MIDFVRFMKDCHKLWQAEDAETDVVSAHSIISNNSGSPSNLIGISVIQQCKTRK